jgi:kumamolisin
MPSHSGYISFPKSNRRVQAKGIVREELPSEEFSVRVSVRPKEAHADFAATARALPKDRKYLTHAEHAQKYGADPNDIKAVADFAAKHGLKVVSTDAAQRSVLLSGTPAAFSQAFRVQLFGRVVNGKVYRDRTGMIYIPSTLAPVITGVYGLSNLPFAKPHFRVTPRERATTVPAPARQAAAVNPPIAAAAAAAAWTAATPANPPPAAHANPTGAPAATATTAPATAAPAAAPHGAPFPTGFAPPQIAALYNFPQNFDGTGQTIAILELGGGFRTDEVNTYFGNLKIPTPNITVQSYPNGGSNNPGTDPLDPANADVEVMLDIQVVGSVAPGAHLVVYFAPDASDKSFLDVMSAIVHDTVNNPSVISISWGGSEDSATDQFKQEFDSLLQSAAQLGITVCVASGDDGSADFASDDPNWDGNTHVDFPASDPFALACGGTQLNASNGQVTSEVTWNEGVNDGSGGGVSRFFALPAYQQNAGVPGAVSPPGNVMRGVPDVAGNAAEATGYQVLCDGQKFPDPAQGIPPVGGTSAVAPLWAGLIARINQALGTRAGFLNPLLYGIPANSGGFSDITQGNNGAYNAGAGWDPCTGLGSPNGEKLLHALQGPTPGPPPTPSA